MKNLSFFAAKPSSLPPGTVLYRLDGKRRYDLHTAAPDFGAIGGMTYFADGPTAPHGANFSFAVDDLLQFTREGSGPGRGGVLRLLFLKRADGITRQQFARHWRDIHAPLAMRHNPSFDHYVTNIVLDEASEWDGILEEWFASEDVFDRHDQGLAEHKRIVGEDIPLFVKSVALSPQVLGREIYRQESKRPALLRERAAEFLASASAPA